MAQPRKDKDPLGTRMKDQYESRSQTHLPRRTYTVIRLDGKAFHTYTRGLERPFDAGLMEDMDNTAKALCEQIQGAKMAYVQSDEISIIIADFDDITTQAWFDGNVQKMTSISASIASAVFNQKRLWREYRYYQDTLYERQCTSMYAPSEDRKLAYFDSRVFTIPDPTEVENYLVWRQQDATRNSIQMAAQSMFSSRQLHGVNTNQLQEKMWSEKGVNWNDYPDGFKRGRCVVKETYIADFPMQDYAHDSVKELAEANGATRSRWIVEAPPVFTQDREYMRSRLPKW